MVTALFSPIPLLSFSVLLIPLRISYFRRGPLFKYYKLESFPRMRSCMSTATSASLPPTREDDSAKSSSVKRKVAIVLSYVGSNYYGLQIHNNDNLPTIEMHLENALYATGCILPTNKGDLAKLGWSRSSRTDKGVHSARSIISAKLEIDTCLLDANLSAPELCKSINAHLPSDIRVMSIKKIYKGFRARDACHWREYEYNLPVEVLTTPALDVNQSALARAYFFSPQARELTESPHWIEPPSTTEEARQRMNSLLKKYEGSRSFHNFHRIARRDLEVFSKGAPKMDRRDDRYTESMATLAADKSSLPQTILATSAGSSDDKPAPAARDLQMYNFYLFESWERTERIINSKTNCNIYSCEVVDTSTHSDGKEYFRIRIRGQSFLLHQIRLMIGGAVLACRGIFPSYALDLALKSSTFINVPLAPSQGLVLLDAGFGPVISRLNRPSVVLSRFSGGASKSIDDKVAGGGDQRPNDAEFSVSLMSDDEYRASEEFKRKYIHPRIFHDWGAVTNTRQVSRSQKSDDTEDEDDDGNDNEAAAGSACWADIESTLVDRFLLNCERYRVPPEVDVLWQDLLEESVSKGRSEDLEKLAKESRRVLRNIAMMKKDLQAFKAKEDKYDKSKNRMIVYQELLPNAMATKVVNRLRVVPPPDTLVRAFQSVASALIEGTLSLPLLPRDEADKVVTARAMPAESERVRETRAGGVDEDISPGDLIDVDALVEAIVSRGDIQWWAQQPRLPDVV